MKRFEEKDWTFLNINSPADLWADYRPSGAVSVMEYDRCRNGHFLISKFYIDNKKMCFKTEIENADDGAAVGVYFGKGGFDQFWEIVITREGVSVQRPGGTPLGDTFRYEGTTRMENLDFMQYPVRFPVEVQVKKVGEICSIELDGKKCLQCSIPFGYDGEINEEMRWGRLLLGAVNRDSGEKAEAVFRSWHTEEECHFLKCQGYLENPNGKVMAGYSIHLCGAGEFWTRTDSKGRFSFEGLPYGIHWGVAGISCGDYWKIKLEHKENILEILEMQKEKEPYKQIFQEIECDTVRINLNGIWDFDWDREEKGEDQAWFQPENHSFSKIIRVPFSFHSLEAFGEGFLAEDENMLQAASWYVNLKETGTKAWYQRKAIIPEKGEWELILGGICGYAKVWINEEHAGCTVDSYEKFRFYAGNFERGEIVTITIMAEYTQNDHESCRGKQDFWFHASPGIWQTVWMEKIHSIRAEDILVTTEFCQRKTVQKRQNEDEEKVNVKGSVFWDIPGKDIKNLNFYEDEGTLSCDITDFPGGVYRLVLEYESDHTEEITIEEAGQAVCSAEWDATGKSGYSDRKILYVSLRGEGQIKLTGWKYAFRITAGHIERIVYPEYMKMKFFLRYEEQSIPFGQYLNNGIEVTENGKIKTDFFLSGCQVKCWNPESPILYDLIIEIEDEMGRRRFQRKTGFRSVDTARYIRINGKDTYIRGVLDQGYNPWGLYTYPAAYERVEGDGNEGWGRGTMEYDIRTAKESGYNLIRMHIKDNEPEWYQICDKIGMMVWDEHPLNFYAKWSNARWRSMYYRRLKDMIRKINYHPSVILYSTFNESWGIMGGHELSAWEIAEAQQWQKSIAFYFRKNSGNVLVIDNSGYAKTKETDVLDYHVYPDEFEDARVFFARLEKENYRGSYFNCYNKKNRELMKNDTRRELLQRNCRINLESAQYAGDEEQCGQPVLVSEFVHTGRLDQMVRTYAGIAGFVRMNIASQENEDTSVLTATRIKRDFGYRHYDFSKADYVYINGENLIWLDMAILTKRQAGEKVLIPVYTRIWNCDRRLKLYIYESRIDLYGNECMPELIEICEFQYIQKEPVKIKIYEYTTPEKCRAVQLFFVIKDKEEVLAENDIRFEVFDKNDNFPQWEMIRPVAVDSEESHGSLGDAAGREGYYLYGKGMAEWNVPCTVGDEDDKSGRWILKMEISTCECVGGTRITDEKKYSGYVTVELNKSRRIRLFIEDCPWDEKAVFSNSGCSDEMAVPYKKWGKYGYGFQQKILLSNDEIKEIKKKGYLTLTVYSEETGAVIYGRRLGRYGAEPMVTKEGAE